MIASRLHWRLLVGTILVLMAATWIAPRWIPIPGLQENRVLAARPELPRRFRDFKAFRKAADAYVADRFPARPYLISALNRLRMLVGVSGSSRVIVGRQGWLFFDDDTHLGSARGDPPIGGPEARAWLMTLAGRTEALKARGIPYIVVATPVKETIYPQFGPRWYAGPGPHRPTILLPSLARAAGVGDVLYLHDAVAQATRAGQPTFSRHDTHWTGYGAYAGYRALMERLHALGIADPPDPYGAFGMNPAHQSDQPRDLALMLGVAKLVDIRYPHIENLNRPPPQVSVTYLSAKHDWTAPQVLDTGAVGKPVLLLNRDSFSNELLPFLYPHFSRIILAHNQDGSWRPDLIDRFKPDLVILEVVEHGLRVSMGDGPAPSNEAVARINHALAGAQALLHTPLMPRLTPADAKTSGVIAAAVRTDNCNFEIATLTPGLAGEATFAGSGWLSELGTQVISPDGVIVLKGPGGLLAAPIRFDKSRPDVAAYYKNPTARESGFVGTFFVAKLPAGTYSPFVYRRSGAGWIACAGKQALVAP